MNITFIVGNGFDIGLGLKTSYNSFISRYADLSQPHDSHTAEYALKKRICRDRLSWSDAEIAYAQLPFEDILNGCADFNRAFLELLSKFQGELNEYLRGEERRFTYFGLNSDNQAEFIARIFSSIIEGLQPKQKGIFINELENGEHRIRSINFNYTKTFDSLICPMANEFLIEVQNRKLRIQTTNVIHVHGTLEENNSIFGITDAQYIRSLVARDLCRLTSTFLKEDQDNDLGYGGYASAKNAIKDADIIVIFGTSMGKSDSAWWSTLVSCLKMNGRLQIFLYDYTNNPKAIKSSIDNKLLQKRGREALLHSLPDRNDEIEMADIWPCVNRITVLNDGPYTRLDGSTGMGDPWDLSGWAKKFVR